MNLSRTVDHKGSKVLKVALSAAMAVAFAPVAAVPAFAAQSVGSSDAGVSALGINKDGTISYDGELKEDAAKPAKVTLWGADKYEFLRFVPGTSGTYCFSSAGTKADVAAELYDTVSSGSGVALGTKLTQGDNEDGINFKVYATLAAGTTYVLRVGISPSAKSGQTRGSADVSVAKAAADNLGSYEVELSAGAHYYSDEGLTAASPKLDVVVKSSIDGSVLSSENYDRALFKSAAGTLKAVSKITEAGSYALKVTAKKGNIAQVTGETVGYFDVLDAADIANYDFKYDSTLMFTNGQIASITAIAPVGCRYGSVDPVFTEANLKVVGWYKVTSNGKVGPALRDAPHAAGSYALRLSPVNAVGKTGFDTKSAVDLKFSIVTDSVAAPIANTGLVYTGKAQVGVPEGSGYKLSGISSATDAGDYKCTATPVTGYSWTDGTTEPKTLTWSIAKAKTAVPQPVSGLTYNGKLQTGVAKGDAYKLSGVSAAIEPGEYSCTATPTSNYLWEDGTSGAVTVKWSIAKGNPNIVATPASVIVDAGGKATVDLKQAGLSAYSVASSDNSVVTASVLGSKVTISAVKSGSAQVTVSTAATSRFDAGSAVVTVSVPLAAGVTESVPGATSSGVVNKYKVTTKASATDSKVVPAVAFVGTTAKSGKFSVPASVTLSDGISYKVTSIGGKALKGKKFSSITISKNATKIGKEAFAGCKKLKAITIPAKVKKIDAGALKGAGAKIATVKTAKLNKASIKGLVKGSKLTTIKCSGVNKKVKAKYTTWAKAYKPNIKVK